MKINLSFLKKINFENFNKALEKFDKGMSVFNKTVKDFGDSMDIVTKEFSSDIEKSNKRVKEQERKNKENLKKIWGDKKWKTIIQKASKN